MKKLIILLSLAALACGVQTTLPESPAKIAEIPTQLPTAVPTHLLIGVTPVVLRGMVTADTLYVREKASTSEPVLYPVLVKWQIVNIGAMVKNETVDCQNWYPLIDRPGFICADFVEVK